MSAIKDAEILFSEAQRMGLNPVKLTVYGAFTFTYREKPYYFFDSKSVLNTQLASYLAKNKHLTRIILEQSHLPNIPYLLPESMDDAQAFLVEHKRIVLKPTLGTNSQDVYVIEDTETLYKHGLHDSILEKYIRGRELRYLLLDKQCIAVHERIFPGQINDPEHVRRISVERSEWSEELKRIAIAAADAIGLGFAAVDFKVTEDSAYILEINSTPGLERFHFPNAGPPINVAKLLLKKSLNI